MIFHGLWYPISMRTMLGAWSFLKKSRILVSDQEFTQTMRMYGLGRTSGGYIKKGY